MIVFDLMGTLFEEGRMTERLQSILEDEEPNLGERELRKVYLEYSRGELPQEHFWKRLTKDVKREFLNSLKLKKDAIDVLDYFEDRKLGILSNLPKPWLDPLLKKRSLGEYFSTVVISGRCGYRKPEKKIYELFLEKAGVRSEECCFVDDKLKNLKTASEFGMETVWISTKNDASSYKPDHRIKNLDELKELL
ncbi:MAG: HAD family hydrolase [Candidatus Aenigmatarchaeota archaeon]